LLSPRRGFQGDKNDITGPEGRSGGIGVRVGEGEGRLCGEVKGKAGEYIRTVVLEGVRPLYFG